MSSNSTGVKDYRMIRSYLSLIYLYGYFSREDFSRILPKKSSSYDVVIRYIKDIYPELTDGSYRDGKKYLAVDRGNQPSDEDRLANSYFLSTVSDDELSDVLQLLRDLAAQAVRAKAMTDSLEDPGRASTVRRRMQEMEAFGYLELGKGRRYAVRRSFLRGLSDEELTDLCRFVRFCGNVTYPRIPARFLLRSIDREYLRRGLPLPQKPLFRFLNNPNHNVLEEELVFTLCGAIREKRRVSLQLQVKGGGLRTLGAIPVGLRLDRRLGRWYLLSASEEEGPSIRRLTFIQKIWAGEVCPAEAWEQARQAVRSAFAHSRFSGRLPEEGPAELRFRLRFDNPGLERQFIRELRGGEILEEDGGRVFRDVINDPIELVPLLRSYAPWIVPEHPDGEAERWIRDGLTEMKRQLSGEARV